MEGPAKENRNEYMRLYMRGYRKKHREEINARARQWAADHPDRVKEQQARYWEKRARESAAEVDA